jgi:MFS family permease
MRGRVMALYGLVFLGSTPLGGPFLGWLSGQWGARWGLAVSVAVSLAAALVAAGPLVVRRWRTTDDLGDGVDGVDAVDAVGVRSGG